MLSAANVPVHAHIFNETQWCTVQAALLCLGSVVVDAGSVKGLGL